MASKDEFKNNVNGENTEDKNIPATGYIEGYNKLIKDQDVELSPENIYYGGTWSNRKYLFSSDEDPDKQLVSAPSKKQFMTNEDENFLVGINDENSYDFFFEVPTYLTFDISVIVEDSPLFNYGDDLEIINNKHMNNSSSDFILKYKTIPAIYNRQPLLLEFINNVLKIIPSKDVTNNGQKKYYIADILGLDKLQNKFIDYEKDVLTIKLTEDVSFRVAYLAELYNNLVYSYQEQKHMIPDNCLRFDMEIKITDVRKFKITETNNKSKQPSITYRLYDCNFDFFDSRITKETAISGGFQALDMSASDMSFKVKYKSVERVFRSPLIFGSGIISNKKFAGDGNSTSGDLFVYNDNSIFNIKEYDKVQSPQQTSPIEKTLHKIDRVTGNNTEKKIPQSDIDEQNIVKGKMGPLRSGDPIQQSKFKQFLGKTDLAFVNDGLKNNLNAIKDNVTGELKAYGKNIVDDLEKNAIAVINRGVMELRNARGNMINKLTEQIRGKVNVPKIYPDNVYDADFGKFTLDNVASSLTTDLYNDTENTIKNLLNGRKPSNTDLKEEI